MKKNALIKRHDVPSSDKWNLSSLFASDSDWEKSLASIDALTARTASFKGRLGESASTLREALRAFEEADKTLEAVFNYASLKFHGDETDPAAQDMNGRAMMAFTKYSAALSFMDPEIQSIEAGALRGWMAQDEFADCRVFLEKLLRQKAHILGEGEERILSLQSQSAECADKAFSALTNADMNFGILEVGGEEKNLTQSTWSVFMESPDRALREKAYKQFYAVFEEHQRTLASLYESSVSQDVFMARARGYRSCLERALFPDNVPESVYRNLISVIHKNLPALHKYYALRKKALGVDTLRHYDVYVPLVKDVKMRTTYDEAVEICRAALAPLGEEYTSALCAGLKGGWVDRYENYGKRSGAFSSGVYKGDPYILMNYKDDSLRDVFTMAHEGGHSMHSLYSARNNPYLQYNYTIFEAEVASTFNEELVFEHLLRGAKDKAERAYLLSMRAGDILATLYRQTMFAEFELEAHEAMESGTPLSAEVLRKMYRALLELYFGSEMRFEENSDMEGLRIPHFYSAFYVYKYATGISAALALARKVTRGGKKERDDYFSFLKSGGSRWPIDSLRMAGVDMESSESVQSACDVFASIVDELEKTI